MLDSRLGVRTVVGGLVTPTSIAFLGPNDILAIEKNTGRVQRVVNGTIQGTVLDLAVNFGSERGLLGIALHPTFPANPGVYLYWTESTTGADTDVLSQTPLLGNRVDRFVWNGSTLTFDRNLIQIRAIQEDAGQPARGNHDGGVLAFGADGKLFVFTGDVGRRGHLQNLPCGPTATCPGPTVPDDQFGGPEPDNAHRTGVVLRLNHDGTTPTDNPFFAAGAAMPQFAGDLFIGAATPLLEGGYLFHFNLTGNRTKVGVDDPRLEDRVADNVTKHEITESESLLIGRDFGVATDIETAPNGNLFVVSPPTVRSTRSSGAADTRKRRGGSFAGPPRGSVLEPDELGG
jgi:hypothetical protein